MTDSIPFGGYRSHVTETSSQGPQVLEFLTVTAFLIAVREPGSAGNPPRR